MRFAISPGYEPLTTYLQLSGACGVVESAGDRWDRAGGSRQCGDRSAPHGDLDPERLLDADAERLAGCITQLKDAGVDAIACRRDEVDGNIHSGLGRGVHHGCGIRRTHAIPGNECDGIALPWALAVILELPGLGEFRTVGNVRAIGDGHILQEQRGVLAVSRDCHRGGGRGGSRSCNVNGGAGVRGLRGPQCGGDKERRCVHGCRRGNGDAGSRAEGRSANGQQESSHITILKSKSLCLI